jgi:hypothetical protein
MTEGVSHDTSRQDAWAVYVAEASEPPPEERSERTLYVNRLIASVIAAHPEWFFRAVSSIATSREGMVVSASLGTPNRRALGRSS